VENLGEVELIVELRWWQWWLQIRWGGMLSNAQYRSRELAAWKRGEVAVLELGQEGNSAERATGRRSVLFKPEEGEREGVVPWRQEKEGGSVQAHHVNEGEGRRGGPGAAVGGSGWPATAPGHRARAAPCRANRGAWGVDRWATATVLGSCTG
jgi:hypothetical protein